MKKFRFPKILKTKVSVRGFFFFPSTDFSCDFDVPDSQFLLSLLEDSETE